MAVFTHVIRKARDGVRRVVRNAMALKNLGIHPDAVPLPFLNLQFRIRTNGVQLLLDDILSFQEPFLHVEPVPFLAGVRFDIVRHQLQRSLLAVRLDPLSHRCVLKTNGNGDVHVAVNNAGHDELAAQVLDLAFVTLQAGFIAHIHKFTVLYHQGRCQGLVLVRSKNFCVFDNLVRFHGYAFI